MIISNLPIDRIDSFVNKICRKQLTEITIHNIYYMTDWLSELMNECKLIYRIVWLTS